MSQRAIQAIDKGVVHKICSGQVVLDVSTAVKELVENALDAGGDRVDVRLVDCGLTSIEVSDNGSGIGPDDYEVLAVKHTTSKIAVFSDLESVQSFGFRGEALSSLCAIGDGITVSTRTAMQAVATKLVYDRNGVLVSRSPCARKQGTTVSVTKLFSSLPVRLKDFELNKPRELHRTIKRVQAYALVCTNVKFSFVSVDGGRSSTILTTQGSSKLRDNFCTVFSAKQADMLADFNCSGADWHVNGLFSKPIPSAGMASAERQFLFLNDRPIDFPKITRVCNEMYRRVSHSHPIFVLNIVTPTQNVDVNLTPDKRTVLLHNEIDIISTIQASLKAMFEPTVQVFQVQTNTLDAFSTKIVKCSSSYITSAAKGSATGADVEDVALAPSSSCAATVEEEVIKLASSSPSQSGVEISNEVCTVRELLVPHDALLSRTRASCSLDVEDMTSVSAVNGDSHDVALSSSDANGLSSNVEDSNCAAARHSDMMIHLHHSLPDDPSKLHASNTSSLNNASEVEAPKRPDITASTAFFAAQIAHPVLDDGSPLRTSIFSKFSRGSATSSQHPQSCLAGQREIHSPLILASKVVQEHHSAPDVDSGSEDSITISNSTARLSRSTRSDRFCSQDRSLQESSSESEEPRRRHLVSKDDLFSKRAKACDENGHLHDAEQEKPMIDSEPVSEFLHPLHPLQTTPAVSLKVDWGKLMQQASSGLGSMNSSGWKMWGASNSDHVSQSGSHGSENIEYSKNETHGLSHGTILTERKIDKADFTRMEVMGQFNKGFIIARLVDDLYIIDQHASDEKCRFEMLQRNTVLRTQPLISPLPLDLSPGDEEILEQRASIFMKSGFNFRFDDSDRPGRRARLTTVPFSHNVQLGPADVQEMLFLLKDNACQLCRPSRITSMFASRACRSAIMIGDPLPLPQMRKVGAALELPSRSPHYAPSLRELIFVDIALNCSSSAPSGSQFMWPTFIRI